MSLFSLGVSVSLCVLCAFAWQAWQIYPQAHAALLPLPLPQLHLLPPLLPAALPDVFAAQKNHRPNQHKVTLSMSRGHQSPSFKLRPNVAKTLAVKSANAATTTPSAQPNIGSHSEAMAITTIPPTTQQVAQVQQTPLPFPNPAHALLVQGQAYQQQGKWAVARQLQEQAWQMQASAHLAWQLAVSHDQLGTRGEAKYFYRQALRADFSPSTALAPNERATVLARLQQLGG